MGGRRKPWVGVSGKHRELLALIDRIARNNVEILFTGETGVGKEQYARYAHERSPRGEKPFVPVNCGSIPADLFENELFGHIGGAFTGARPSAQGLVASAEGGTLFFDEVDALAAANQVKLLRLLQEREYRRLGDARMQDADVRVLAATNRDLVAAARTGAFREDLLYRLRVVPVAIAPLRERIDDIADQKAVEHEVAFIDEQIASGTEQLREQAKTQGETHSDIDPLTGATVEKTVVSTETSEEAAERQKLVETKDTAAPDAANPEAGSAAEPAAPKSTAYEKFGKGVNATARVAGRGMGAVMMFQSIKGSAELISQYRNDNVTLGQVAAGVPKNLLNLGIGYRMLREVHVSPVEFMIVSALEVTEALLGDYSSTAERNTEVTYALISAGLNTALMYVGGWLMTMGPIGIIAGFIVMAAGDHILNALGVKAWLAKMFDPRPNEIIEADRELQKMVEKYAFAIGAAELEGEKDGALIAYGASDPAAVRAALEKQLEKRRASLMKQEVDVVDAFDAAYKRAQKGYAGLKWLDDQRARFLSLYLKVHQNKPIPEAGQLYLEYAHWYSSVPTVKTMMGKDTVLERLQATEGFISLSNATEDDVRGMEQWSKLNERINELVGLLYHDEVNADNYEYVDWMKVFEAISMLEQMIANARYRLDPSKQGTHRVAPLLSDGPARKLYEQLVLQYENRIDVLRERVLDMSMAGGAPTGIEKPGVGFYLGKDQLGLPAIQYDKGTYYQPNYGDVTKSPTEEALLHRLEMILIDYEQLLPSQADEWSELPDGVTLKALKSDIDVIRLYRKRLLHDDGYKAYMSNLQAAREATIGVMERAHRLLDASSTARPKLAKADKDFADAERERVDDYGHYFAEELPALEQKVGMAHATALSAELGDTKDAAQMTAMEHAAATDDKMLEFHLGTIRDRAIKAGVVVPLDPNQAIGRLFAISDRHDVIVAIPPETEVALKNLQYTVYETYDVVPVNDAAVAYVGARAKLEIPLYMLVPVTLNNLRGKKPIGQTTLREKPVGVRAAEKLASWIL